MSGTLSSNGQAISRQWNRGDISTVSRSAKPGRRLLRTQRQLPRTLTLDSACTSILDAGDPLSIFRVFIIIMSHDHSSGRRVRKEASK